MLVSRQRGDQDPTGTVVVGADRHRGPQDLVGSALALPAQQVVKARGHRSQEEVVDRDLPGLGGAAQRDQSQSELGHPPPGTDRTGQRRRGGGAGAGLGRQRPQRVQPARQLRQPADDAVGRDGAAAEIVRKQLRSDGQWPRPPCRRRGGRVVRRFPGGVELWRVGSDRM
jgi:hypothetical protein